MEIQIDAWDRHRLLEDLSRAFSESGANILEARCLSMPPMVKNRFVIEVADTHALEGRDHAPAQHRVGVRRLPGDAGRGGVGDAPAGPSTEAARGPQETTFSARGRTE